MRENIKGGMNKRDDEEYLCGKISLNVYFHRARKRQIAKKASNKIKSSLYQIFK